MASCHCSPNNWAKMSRPPHGMSNWRWIDGIAAAFPGKRFSQHDFDVNASIEIRTSHSHGGSRPAKRNRFRIWCERTFTVYCSHFFALSMSYRKKVKLHHTLKTSERLAVVLFIISQSTLKQKQDYHRKRTLLQSVLEWLVYFLPLPWLRTAILCHVYRACLLPDKGRTKSSGKDWQILCLHGITWTSSDGDPNVAVMKEPHVNILSITMHCLEEDLEQAYNQDQELEIRST